MAILGDADGLSRLWLECDAAQDSLGVELSTSAIDVRGGAALGRLLIAEISIPSLESPIRNLRGLRP
jgi:hypothetical protein